ncbi:MAG: pilus assembly PilX N-terminal domain-containing protein [Halomonas sp.]|nr:pilus assembly PilX N-terminal domain-containing protein [Halomonas sp.]MDP3535342.1 pilus assembly PilX N-terminal domain-containing protein [Halomonas sp.]
MNIQAIPNHQQGAALVMAMVFLASGLMVGAAGLGASLVNERLAGNYRAASIANMCVERAAAQAIEYWDDIPSGNISINVNISASELWDEHANDANNLYGPDAEGCIYTSVRDGDTALSLGIVSGVAGPIAYGEPVLIDYSSGVGGGFGAASILGGIADSALTLPSSAKSGLFGGEMEIDGEIFDIPAFSFASDNGAYTKESIIDGNKAFLNENNVNVKNKVEDQQGLLDVLWELYMSPTRNMNVNTGPGNSGKSSCQGLCFYEDGLDVKGNSALNGLHVVLNGSAQIGGNADVQGMLIVLNIDRNLDLSKKDSWEINNLVEVTQVKFNGGGNKGTVHFDMNSVEDALIGSGVSVAQLLQENSSGGGGFGEGEFKWRYFPD